MRSLEKLDLEKLALVIVDLQKGYCDPSSDCASKFGWNVDGAEKICRAHVPFLDSMRKLLDPKRIIWFRMEEKLETIAPNLRASGGTLNDDEALCVSGTPGHDYHIVHPVTGEPEFQKFHSSCFTNSKFRDYLKQHDITQLAFTGVIGSRCVNATILGASERGMECIALMDLIGGPDRFKEEMDTHLKVTTFLYALPLQSAELVSRTKTLTSSSTQSR